jgi:hypothetical protein
MATRTKKQQQTETVDTTSDQEATEVRTQVTEQSETVDATPGVQTLRASLRAAGLKRCPAHDHYMNRLPEAFRTPVERQMDPAIRPLDEFTDHIAACKQCAKLRSADKRALHRDESGKPANSVARLARLLQKRAEIDTAIATLGETLTDVEQSAAHAIYRAATIEE